MMDLRKNGLRFFVFCADPISLFTSSVETLSLFAGGQIKNKYLPYVGSRIPTKMKEFNRAYIETFMS